MCIPETKVTSCQRIKQFCFLFMFLGSPSVQKLSHGNLHFSGIKTEATDMLFVLGYFHLSLCCKKQSKGGHRWGKDLWFNCRARFWAKRNYHLSLCFCVAGTFEEDFSNILGTFFEHSGSIVGTNFGDYNCNVPAVQQILSFVFIWKALMVSTNCVQIERKTNCFLSGVKSSKRKGVDFGWQQD